MTYKTSGIPTVQGENMTPLRRLCICLFVCAAFGSAQAATVDLALNGVGGFGSVYQYQAGSAGVSWSVSGLSPSNAVTVDNGDTINVTLTFDSPAIVNYPYGLRVGMQPSASFAFSLWGPSVQGYTTTVGVTSLYKDHQLIDSGQNVESMSVGGIFDSATFSSVSAVFDTVIGSFSVSGLTQSAQLEQAMFSYKAFAPTQQSVPAPIFEPFPIQIQPEVPEPTSAALALLGLTCLAAMRRTPT